jgi:hypothetical protein
MLLGEIGRRRAAKLESKAAVERLLRLKTERLRPVAEGAREMIAALPEGASRGSMRLQDEGSKIRLFLDYASVNPPEQISESFILEWDVKNFDLEVFGGLEQERADRVAGYYLIRLPDGILLKETEAGALLRRLSGLVADRLA